jgi:hypothetical protein
MRGHTFRRMAIVVLPLKLRGREFPAAADVALIPHSEPCSG